MNSLKRQIALRLLNRGDSNPLLKFHTFHTTHHHSANIGFDGDKTNKTNKLNNENELKGKQPTFNRASEREES
jgi:hypothetical protein